MSWSICEMTDMWAVQTLKYAQKGNTTQRNWRNCTLDPYKSQQSSGYCTIEVFPYKSNEHGNDLAENEC